MKKKDCEKLISLYNANVYADNCVCDTMLIPDYFDVKATSKTAGYIEDVVNIMLR